jgi:biofilm PGA synthesis N-glycosyltransferase PgaC
MLLDVSIGVMAYNEESNIGQLLQSLSHQELSAEVRLEEIIVVASGCTDNTEEIVRRCMKQDKRIRLLVQTERQGKASAINLFLSRASGDIFILESADTLPEDGTIAKLVTPFRDQRIGMTGARPVPVNLQSTFMGFIVHLMWHLHHRIALVTPKLGELIAFRNFVRHIPADTAVDEASIEAIVRGLGYRLCYVPTAVVRNKGPENVKDFLKQRRRIAAGHKHLLLEENYRVSTSSSLNILTTLLEQHRWNVRDTFYTACAIGCELTGRMLGYYDFYCKKQNPFMWDIASSTKRLD